MNKLLARIAAKKAELDRLRPISGGAFAQLQKHYHVELTYTSRTVCAGRAVRVSIKLGFGRGEFHSGARTGG
jgi:hypothetical protein